MQYTTGLLNLTHRYYDGATGRFLTRDPIGYGGGANLYGFADNNPVNRSDPSGHGGGSGGPGNSSDEEDGDDIFGQRLLQRLMEQEREKEEEIKRAREDYLARLAFRTPIIRSFPEWEPGGPITQLTPEGRFPEWFSPSLLAKGYTIQGRYWINRGTAPGADYEFNKSQINSMRSGFAPQARVLVRIRKTGEFKTITVSKELHHAAGRDFPEANQPFNLYEVWPWEYELIDPHRKTGYDFIKFAK